MPKISDGEDKNIESESDNGERNLVDQQNIKDQYHDLTWNNLHYSYLL